MTGLVWTLEWRIALRRRRLFALNIAIPLLLVAPIAFSDAPPAHAAAVYAILFTLFGTFGQTIPLVRDAERGLLQRILLSGLPARRLVLQRILAQATLDALQLLPALLLILAAGPADPLLAAALPVILVATLVAANTLGACIAAMARSLAEAALFAAVAALFALHGAGVFRTPTPGSAAARVEAALPFRYLHDALLHVTGGGQDPSLPTLVAGASAGAAAALLAAALLAPAIAAGLGRIHPR